MSNDDIGDRMKSYERVETEKRVSVSLPIVCRVDGRGFSKFTRNFVKPFDKDLSAAMIAATRFVMEQTHCQVAYTQSDEATFVWKPVDGENSQSFFDGKIQKLTSIIASAFAVKFITSIDPIWHTKLPHFDARVFNVSDLSEAANVIVWREIDARKNAISMLAREYFSHKQLQSKSGKDMLQMLAEQGVHFETYPEAFKSGTLLVRNSITRELTDEELSVIPEEYRPVGPVTRSHIKHVDVYPFSKVSNKAQVLFENEEAKR